MPALPQPRWARLSAPDASVVGALGQALRLPPVVCGVLAARRHHDPEVAKRFLRPRLEHLHDPEALADGPRAADRIVRAVESNETIFVHGDYDVDGICATALYTRFLEHVGGKVVPFVPHRRRDGYDFGEAGLRAAEEAGATLVLTADCGTTAVDSVGQARSAGRDVIVTDHHTPGPETPPATALVNPQRADCLYPEKGLCGAGVAFKVCQLVGSRLGTDPDELLTWLDLVALATVADLVPLQGENRVLVRYGLRRFPASSVPGLRALLEVSGVDRAGVTTGRLGFVIAPRINAAGRIGESADALRLLLTDDRAEARQLAARLDGINRERQEEDRRTLEEAMDLLTKDFDPEKDRGIVLAKEGWHPGVIGIVASRIVERIHRPVVLIALEGSMGRGSARSIPGFHLYDALDACRSHLRRFGGHRQAAGMDVDRAAVPALRESFDQEARRRLGPDDLSPVLRSDLDLDLNDVDLELVHWLDYLGPHGMGNPRPVFFVGAAQVEGVRVVKEEHLKLSLRVGEATLDAIGFGLARRHHPDRLASGPHDVLLRLERNEWRGVARPQAQVVDLRPTEQSS